MAEALSCDVLIVGAGPTGVTLGALLAKRGIATLVIDKEADVFPLPRAAHIDHETVRTFQEIGAADAVLRASRSSSRYDFLTARGDVLMRFDGLDQIGAGGWPIGNMIHQPSVERAVRATALELPAFALRTRCTWIDCTEEDGAVRSIVESEGGRIELHARYLIGCDGARSPVRTALGIAQDDLNFDEEWLVIDAIVHDASRLPPVNLQICDPERPTTCVLMGANRHRWEFMVKPGEKAEDIATDESIAALLKPWNVDGAVTLERKAVYRFNARVAEQWRKGRVLLAGDAAHLTPPFAGQGLCAGLRDAANLAWKLDAVLKGADERLLDAYQSEREPHARTVIQLAIMMGRTVCITDPAAAQARDQVMSAQARSGAPGPRAGDFPPLAAGCILEGAPCAGSYFPQPVCADAPGLRFDDVVGAGPVLFARACVPQDHSVKCVSLSDAALAPFHGMLVDWFDRHGVDAVLVRPDHYIFGAGAPEDLLSAWRAWFAAAHADGKRRPNG